MTLLSRNASSKSHLVTANGLTIVSVPEEILGLATSRHAKIFFYKKYLSILLYITVFSMIVPFGLR